MIFDRNSRNFVIADQFIYRIGYFALVHVFGAQLDAVCQVQLFKKHFAHA